MVNSKPVKLTVEYFSLKSSPTNISVNFLLIDSTPWNSFYNFDYENCKNLF